MNFDNMTVEPLFNAEGGKTIRQQETMQIVGEFFQDLKDCFLADISEQLKDAVLYGGITSYMMHGTDFIDYDISIPVPHEQLKAIFLQPNNGKKFQVTASRTAITFIDKRTDNKFQFIAYNGGDNFDLLHCQVGFRVLNETWTYSSNEAYEALLGKQLYLGNGVRNPFYTLFRVQKYLMRGFNLPQKEYAKLMALITQVNAYDSVNAYGLLIEVAKAGASS